MPEDRVFGPAVRRRYSIIVALMTFGSALLPFAVGLLLLTRYWPEHQDLGSGAVAMTALLLALLGPWLVHNHLGLAGNAALRARLWQRVRERFAGMPGNLTPAFVGFSPGDRLLIWDGDTDQDIGFLAAWGDALVYHGDLFSWRLPRDYITAIESTGEGPLLDRITVRCAAPREAPRAFTFVSREARDLREARRATQNLLAQLSAWHAAPAADDSALVPPLGLPPYDTRGGVEADYLPRGSCASAIAISLVAVIAVWHQTAPLIRAGRYHHAVLWSGAILVLAALVANSLLRLLQWAERADRADRAAAT